MNLMWFDVTLYLVFDNDHICDFSSPWWFVCNSQILTSSWGKLPILFINTVLNLSTALSIFLTKLLKAIQDQHAPAEKILFSAATAKSLQENLLCDGVSIQWAVCDCHTFSLLFIALSDSSLTWSYFFYTRAQQADLWLTACQNETLHSTSSGTIWIHHMIEMLNCHFYFERNHSPFMYLVCNIHDVHF